MTETTKPGYTKEQWILVVLLILMVFPAVFGLFLFMLTFPAKLLMSPLLLDGDVGKKILGISVSVVDAVAIVIAFAGAFQICKAVWPRKQET